MKHGLLLINIGTPQRADVMSVARYLSAFLSDPRVIDLPALARYLLVYGLILPFRTKSSTSNYRSIWTKKGSPLLVLSNQLVNALKKESNNSLSIALGMRYGSPSIEDALDALKHCDSITVLPLYPQYSSAATGSAIEKVFKVLSNQTNQPNLKIIRNFFEHPAFIEAQAELLMPYLSDDIHIIFSYHGIPERQIIQAGCSKVCEQECRPDKSSSNRCYRAQCYETSRLLAKSLELEASQYTIAFQSRVGKAAWIKPYTTDILETLAQRGIKNIAISCPSFVTDCLETLEEMGIRAKKQWKSLGGNQCTLIPSLNTSPKWVKAILTMTSLD